MESTQKASSQLLLEYKLTVVRKEPKKDRVTQLVMEYKETGNAKLLTEIQMLTKDLVWDTVRYYGINNFNNVDMDEVLEDCKSWVLLRTIDKFDPYKGAKFTTHYTWWLSSHCGSKQRQYMRRRDIFETAPLDAILGEDGENQYQRHSGGKEYTGPVGNVENILSNGFSINIKNRIYKHKMEVFGLTERG